MKIFVGLGNPGSEYAQTRHNMGWLCLDYLREKYNLPEFSEHKKMFSHMTKNDQVIMVKPQTYMNDSGKAVQAVLKWSNRVSEDGGYPQLYIFHDDLDIQLGKFKMQYGSGPKVHNGVNSVRNVLKTEQFWVVRIGVDDREGDRSMPGSAYVLQKLSTKSVQSLYTMFNTIYEELSKKISP